jgi:hypothetical protein
MQVLMLRLPLLIKFLRFSNATLRRMLSMALTPTLPQRAPPLPLLHRCR